MTGAATGEVVIGDATCAEVTGDATGEDVGAFIGKDIGDFHSRHGIMASSINFSCISIANDELIAMHHKHRLEIIKSLQILGQNRK